MAAGPNAGGGGGSGSGSVDRINSVRGEVDTRSRDYGLSRSKDRDRGSEKDKDMDRRRDLGRDQGRNRDRERERHHSRHHHETREYRDGLDDLDCRRDRDSERRRDRDRYVHRRDRSRSRSRSRRRDRRSRSRSCSRSNVTRNRRREHWRDRHRRHRSRSRTHSRGRDCRSRSRSCSERRRECERDWYRRHRSRSRSHSRGRDCRSRSPSHSERRRERERDSYRRRHSHSQSPSRVRDHRCRSRSHSKSKRVSRLDAQPLQAMASFPVVPIPNGKPEGKKNKEQQSSSASLDAGAVALDKDVADASVSDAGAAEGTLEGEKSKLNKMNNNRKQQSPSAASVVGAVEVDKDVTDDEKAKKVQNNSPRSPIKFRQKKLLILDLNGLLADINQDHHNSHLSHAKDLSMCTATGCNTLENERKPLVLKELKKLWHKEEPGLPWTEGEFSPSNTLLVDDSPYKALRNPLHTAIFPYPYSYKNEADDSLGPGGDLRLYLEKLASTDDVQCYVREHPFGQPPITQSDPNWHFYAQILNGRTVAW